MDIKIINIFKQKIGEKIYYWGKDKENQIYLLNRYTQLNNILRSHPEFSQDHDHILETINFPKDQFINVPRNKIIRIASADYSLS